MAVRSGATAPMSGMSGMWDGAQLEVITTDPTWVGPPVDPGERHGLAVDSKSRVYAVYDRSPSGLLFFRYKDLGGSWSSEIPLPASPTDFPRAGVLVCPGDVPEFLYLEGGKYRTSYLVHALFDFNSSQWTLDTIVRSTQEEWPSWIRIDVGADTLGGFHVVWEEPAWNDELQAVSSRVMYAENTSGAWRTQVVAAIGGSPLLQVSSSGGTIISYHFRRDGHEYSVFATNRSRGDSVWTADSIDTAPAIFGVSDMSLERDGTLHVLFTGMYCSSCYFVHPLFYTHRPPGSKVFEPWYQLYDHAGSSLLFVDCVGHAHAWYYWYDEEEIRRDMFYATNASGIWESQPFHFGEISDDSRGYFAQMLDRFDQGRAVVNQWMDDESMRLLYYAPPTVYFDVVDVVRVINHVYLGKSVCDPFTYDEDCSGSVDVADLHWLINYAFMNGPKGCRF